MKITFIRTSTNAVGEYRMRHPMLALSNLGHQCKLITLDQGGNRTPNTELLCDVLVVQRQTHPSVLDLRDTLPPEVRPVTVYEVDDNPWEWHPFDPVHIELGYEYGKRVREIMRRCDAITCSTPTLADRVRREIPGKPIWVVPNAIDFGYRDWDSREARADHDLEGKVVLGWTGSIHHMRDGGVMLQALPEVFNSYPDTVFLMQCDRNLYQQWTTPLADKGYGKRLRWVAPLPFDIHPRIYSLFDVNLAPLEVTAFNLCKSDLRLVEGGAHSVPYVASKVAPYLEFHRESDGIGGHLAGTVSEWVEGISDLIDEEADARGQSLYRYVRERRALSVMAGQWQTAFEGAKAGTGEAVRVTAGKPTRNDPCPCGSRLKYKKCCTPAYG